MNTAANRKRTALVTGASSGIGAEFANQLASKNFDLILAARRMDRLQHQKKLLESEFNINVMLVECDLSDSSGPQKLFAAVEQTKQPIDLLINNAGLGHYGPTIEQPLDQINEMIAVNLSAVTSLTRLFAEQMVARGSGRILNHASFSGIQPAPNYAVYSATKAYVVAFSQTVNQELKGTGVTVSALCPAFFRTEFFEKSGQRPGFLANQMFMDKVKIARAGITGALRGKAVIIPGIRFKILNLLIRLFPRSITLGAAELVNRAPANVRSRLSADGEDEQDRT